MKGRTFLTVLATAGALLWGTQTRGDSGLPNQKTLAGVRGVFVLVEGISESLKGGGLSEDTLKTDTELRLRAVGIPMLSEEQSDSMPGAAYLYLRVTGYQDTTVGGRSLGYSAAVMLEFRQGVRLERDPSIRVSAPTWSAETTVGGRTVDVVRVATRDMADKFANAYLAANPKR